LAADGYDHLIALDDGGRHVAARREPFVDAVHILLDAPGLLLEVVAPEDLARFRLQAREHSAQPKHVDSVAIDGGSGLRSVATARVRREVAGRVCVTPEAAAGHS